MIDQERQKLSEERFIELAKREGHARTRLRLIALEHLKEGKSCLEVAVMLKVSRISVRHWLNRFLREGIEGVKEKKRSGRKQVLPKQKEEEFRLEVEKLQEGRNGGRIRVKDIQVMLKEVFCCDYEIKSVYDLLNRLGMSWITARSQHPQSDPQQQEDFKKTLKKM